MANNPVQIVLNDKNYIVTPEGQRGGGSRDFFAGRDEDFAKHKAKLASRIRDAAVRLSDTGTGGIGYVKVKLREEALAKSHRPIRTMFRANSFPCVGASGLGELYYFAEANDLAELINKVSEAELETTWVEGDDGKTVARPSVVRSEVGAIEDIAIPDPITKRKFDADTAVSWLSDPRTGGFYLVELFESPRVAERRSKKTELSLESSLSDLITSLGPGLIAWRLPEAGGETPVALKLTNSSEPPLLMQSRPTDQSLTTVDNDILRHENALRRLALHPSVRRISLPLRLELSDITSEPSVPNFSVPPRTPGVIYPKVGIVDSGLGASLAPWILGRHDFLAIDEVDGEHGSFVGGLIVGAAGFNPSIPGLEPDGCDLVDLALYPNGDFMATYANGFADFLDEMDQAIGEAVQQHGIRVINLSINAVLPVETDHYSYYAARMDQIAAKHKVTIINSAGNLPHGALRTPWPKKANEAIKYFAARVEPDTIFVPSESFRAVSVGAINPPGCKTHHEGLPTTYTRRGPGLRVGCKPDVAHYGGNAGDGTGAGHLLTSISPDGTALTACGTSFAAPLVAKSLAALESRIDGTLESHTLRALLIHNCSPPAALAARGLSTLSRQFVGFGVPQQSEEMLTTDDSAITLVFSSRIPYNPNRAQVLRFEFDWPQSLVDPSTGACFGEASATLVYEPPVDRAFGAEFVRVNLDAKLQQRHNRPRKDGLPGFNDRFAQSFLPKTANQPVPEKELINQGLKWWPTKRYNARFPESGLGESSQWRIEVKSTRRAEALFPSDGIPFTLVVTIKDSNGTHPIFPQLRRALQASRVELGELRTHQRIRTTN